MQYLDIIVIATGAILYIFNEIRKELRLKKTAQRHTSLDENIDIDGKIYPILWDIMVTYGAMRVYITQFHNGSNFYTGQSIQRKTVSHEVGQRLIKKIKDFYDNVLISEMYHRILLDMKKGDYFLVPNKQVIQLDEDLHEWMNLYEVESLYYFRIIDKATQHTVATLNIHFDRPDPLTPIQVQELMETKKRLESIFDEL
jgi:hypothetical protein